MAKKKKTASTTFKFRCRPEDMVAFKAAAEREGFSSVSAWLLFHLRRAGRKPKGSKP